MKHDTSTKANDTGWALGLGVVLALAAGLAIAKGKPPPAEPLTAGIYYYS